MGNKELNILKKVIPQLKMEANVVVPPGDDCAAVEINNGKLLLVAVDQLISNVHYLNTTPAEIAGAKLMNRNLSDIAAMGGTPLWALLSLGATNKNSQWYEEFILGAAKAGEVYNVSLIGGDFATSSNENEVASLTIIGEVEKDKVICRTGAKVGDYLAVTGKLGNSFYSQRHLDFTPRLQEGKIIAQNSIASSMIDISDGLLLDAKRLSEASNVGFEIDLKKLPIHADSTIDGALSDGEDYELLFTVKKEKLELLYKECPNVTVIGKVVAGNKITDENGKNLLINREIGYEH